MATLTVQNCVFGGLNDSKAACAAGGDVFANDGKLTFIEILNASASTRTLTVAANDADKPGFGTIATPDTTVTIPGSGTNGGRCKVGPFPADRFNNSSGQVSLTYSDSAADLTIAAIKLTPYS